MHPLFQMAFVSFFVIMCDSLHIMELGVTKRVLGNVCFHLCFTEGLLRGSTPAERVADLWLHISSYYDEHKPASQLSALKLSMFCNEGGSRSHRSGRQTRKQASKQPSKLASMRTRTAPP